MLILFANWITSTAQVCWLIKVAPLTSNVQLNDSCCSFNHRQRDYFLERRQSKPKLIFEILFTVQVQSGHYIKHIRNELTMIVAKPMNLDKVL